MSKSIASFLFLILLASAALSKTKPKDKAHISIKSSPELKALTESIKSNLNAQKIT
jgi:hypothetical protein